VIPDRQSLLSLLTLGIFSQGVGWILISNALPRLRVSLSGLILLLQPALAFVWDVSFFDRPTSVVNWIGVAVVLVAIYMGSARERAGNGPG
jgi:drug/metabolite transporter (DMT)-like permease